MSRSTALTQKKANAFVIISLIIFVAAITITKLFFSTRQVTKGYVLSSLESTHQELVREQEVKEMQISKVRSLKHIEQSDKVRSMVNPNTIVFVQGETVIAQR